ncbi:PREDICTED: uncharacterized protein LOC109476547 [Branchiostoma belcheri]|uniref:Uncharacterized protein LOC109476547 n=1 Tax=Branchiostoma belcheri TaxID=7741 RepID=A0A6P4ZGG5_BRABE|nr:PREDICTED: uncharacterized protein LOC109476547 [Branchiostoma belcheri]
MQLSKVGDGEHTDFVSDMTTLPHGSSSANQIGSIWTSEETHCLIGLWNNNRVLQELEPRWNKKGYELLSRRLRKAGYNRTAAQVNSKVKALKCRYRKHKETVTNSGPGKSDWEFFEELDSFLGDASSTDRLLDTRTGEDEDGEGEVGEDEDVDFVSDTATSPHGPIPAILNKSNQFGSIWTRKETRCLIGLWNNDRVLRELERTHCRKGYELLSRQLQEAGYNRTAAQVKSKVKAMKHRYRRHKETAGKSDWEFFEELDSFLGNVSRPDHRLDTRTVEDEGRTKSN